MTSSNYVPLLWTTPKWINPPPILFLQENLEPPFYDFSKICTPSQQIRGACTLTAGKIFPNSEKMIDSTDSKFQEKYAEYIFTEDDCKELAFTELKKNFTLIKCPECIQEYFENQS